MPAVSTCGRRSTAVVGALALAAAIAACGGGGARERPTADSVAPPGASRSTPAGATVDMADLRFEPRRLTVERGRTVTFRNVGKVTHNAKGRTFFSRVVEPGGSYRHTFDRPGTFDYVCTFHPGMEGILTVK